MDHILYWNDVALETNRRDFTEIPAGRTEPMPEQGGPTLSSRALTIVHLAMYDAHAGAVGNPPGLAAYMPGLPAAGSSNAAAATAAAAHATLSALFPRQKAFFDLKMQQANLQGSDVGNAVNFGKIVAQRILADRNSDPKADATGYIPSLAHGHHREDPMSPGQGYHAPFYGARSKMFAVTDRHELDLPASYQPGGAEYTRSLKQVRSKGIMPQLMGTLPAGADKRTVDESVIGVFWAYDGPRELGTPPRLYNQIVRTVAMNTPNPATGVINNVDQNARLFALVNVAMGDAGILAWDQKYKHDLWRPVLGIREHDNSMGPAATTPAFDINNDCDPEWLPLGAPKSNTNAANGTPPFPAYPSGHATFGAAALHITRMFYGVAANNTADDTIYTGSIVSDELNGITKDNMGSIRPKHVRAFNNGGLWQMIVENGLSRVYLGVHWFFDAFALKNNGKPDLTVNIGGVALGLKIAKDIFSTGMDKSTVPPRP
jgi:hypothetical protein